ncbi:hypothetical protein SDC9_141773 [bioreactor metagenome]|uniref:Uncharacterized protein n=1 Tax=bioreactor metagenome TaxID=1076179 RepID=A0A645DZ80_9ZZZZ
MIDINSSISWGVNTAVGSSKMRTSAPRYNVFRISTLCCIPTVVSSILAEGLTAKRYLLDRSAITAAAAFLFKTPSLLGSLPKMMFSVTVKSLTNIKCWCTIPIPNLSATPGELILTSCPLTLMVPLVGSKRPERIFIKVDLPAPFSPNKA